MNKLFSLLVLNLIFIFASQAQLTQLTNQNLESCSEVRQMVKKGNLIFSKGRIGGIHKSNDTGTSWTYSAHGLDTFTNKIKDLIVFNNDLYVLMDNSRTENPVYKSSDNGVTWQYLGTSVTGLPSRPFNICSIGSANNKAFMIINIHDIYGYGHDSSYIYYSNNATNWNKGAFIGTGWGIEFIHNLSNSKMYFASDFNNVDSLMFTMDGNTIHGIPTTGIDRNEFRAYNVSGEPNGNTLYSIYNSSPYKFDSSTQTWNNIRTASIPSNVAFDMINSTDHLVFGFAFILPAFTATYYRSIDHGNTWTQITDTSIIPPAFLCEISDSQYIIPTQLGEIFYSSNHGASWTKKGNGYQNLSTTSITEVNNTLLVKKDIYGILRSTDKGQTWAYSNTGLSQAFWGLLFANSLFSHNNIAYTTIQPSMDSDTLHFCKSTNSGQSWTRLTNIPNYQRMKYAGESGNTLFMKFVDNDNDGNHDWDTACFFYKTTNAGDSWTLISQNFFTTTLNLKRVNGIFGDGSILYLFATTKDDKEVVCKSTNNGLTWTTIVFNHNIDRRLKTKYSRDNELELPIIDFDDNNMPLFVLTNNNQNPYFDSLFTISANHVVPLNTIGLPSNMSAFELKFNKGYWYISTTVGIYVSRDGINWYKEATTPYYLGMITLKMQFVEDDIFLGTFGNGVWKYTHKKVHAGADIYYCKGDSVTLTATAPDLNFTWCCGLGTNKSVTIAPTGIN
ncbi:MAG: hypothetical protein U9R42_09010, partial [Bacteroidota bacterium]|nr:hypothetical protein [Bacteroidota bacterium]